MRSRGGHLLNGMSALVRDKRELASSLSSLPREGTMRSQPSPARIRVSPEPDRDAP